MSQQLWTAVDEYLGATLVQQDEVLDACVRACDAADLPQIAVSPCQGKLLALLAQAIGARQVLEIGTLGGYSTLWMARALPPGGRIVTLEADLRHAEVANANFARAGVRGAIDLRVGRALDTLPQLAAENRSFDLFFIDADKASIPDYFKWSLRLAHRGSLIVVDNVVRKGAVIDAGSDDAAVQGVRRFNQMVATEPRVSGTAIQTVGVKGHDGFALLRVVADP